MRQAARTERIRPLTVAAAIAAVSTALAAPVEAFVPARVAPEGERAMILLADVSPEACADVERAVTVEEGRVAFVFRPALVVAFLPRAAAARLATRPDVLDVSFAAVERSAYGALGREQEAAIEIWNRVYMGQRADTEPLPPTPSGAVRDHACGVAVPWEYRPESESALLRAKGWGAGPNSTSEYMILDGDGSLHREFHVNLVFPESNGLIDASTEDWTGPETTTMLVECAEGLEWWAARYAPARWRIVLATTWEVGIPWEPINHPHTFESTWVSALMDSLGWGGANYFAKVRNFNNGYLVDADEAWFATIFCVDSSADADGRFTDGWFDYSYFGGPFLVMTWDSGPWGNANTDYLCAHEIGHTFYAKDEYASSGCTDTERHGYLNIANGNCENPDGGAGSVPCIMRNNSRAEFTNGSVCSWTRDTIGWRDTDADSIPDIVDHPPLLVLDDPGGAVPQGFTFTGSVVPEVEPNLNPARYSTGSSSGDSISVNRVTLVEYRLDGGAWTPAIATDGAFDEAAEAYRFAPALSVGLHDIDARATNSRGLVSAIASRSVDVRQGFAWTDDLEDADISDWTITSAGASIALDGAVAHGGTYSLKVTGPGASGAGAVATSTPIGGSWPLADTNEPYVIRFWFRWSSFHWARFVLFGHARLIIDQPGLPLRYDPNGNWTGLAPLGSAFQTYCPAGTWKEIEIAVDPAARQYTVGIGGVALGTATYNPSVLAASSLSFADHYSATDSLHAWYDDFRVVGVSSRPTAVVDDARRAPAAMAVHAAPSPFTTSTQVAFELPRAGLASLRIHDVRGALVRSLVRGMQPAGAGSVSWDGRNDEGRRVAAGVYFVSLSAGGERVIDRVVRLR